MKILIFILICFSTAHANAQTDFTASSKVSENSFENESSESATENFQIVYKEGNVRHHKRKVKLTFVVDSLIISNKSFSFKRKWSSRVRFETDYLNVYDDIFIKIFIARNAEYNKKFY